jgi:mono/diheme cytochrome c family protein
MKRLSLLGLAAVLVWGPVTAARAADKVDFVKQILPILKERCFECHGPKKQKGKLRLDQPKTMI